MASRLSGLRTIQKTNWFRGNFNQTRFSSNITDPKVAAEKASAAVSKVSNQLSSASGKISSTITKTSSLASDIYAKSIYYGKVGAEVAKEVYVKEGMAPPNSQQFNQAKGELCQLVKNFDYKKLEKAHALTAVYYGAQIYGFFLVGEIIGRFNLVGYNV